MSPTLLEAAVVVLLLWLAWQIGKVLAPWILYRMRRGSQRNPAERRRKATVIIEAEVESETKDPQKPSHD